MFGGLYLAPPDDYELPRWPGLYLPWLEPNYLFYPSCERMFRSNTLLVECTDARPAAIWKYTVYWSFVLTTGSFLLCGLWAFLIFARRGPKYAKFAIFLPLIYALLGAIISFVSATVTGQRRLSLSEAPQLTSGN